MRGSAGACHMRGETAGFIFRSHVELKALKPESPNRKPPVSPCTPAMAAVVSNGSAADLRIYKPNLSPGFPSPEEQSDCRSRLLRKIHAFYLKATKRLHGRPPKHRRRRREAAAAQFGVCGGLCFGLLDPVSNIIVNTILSANEGSRRPERTLEDLKHVSLDAMVAFLTRLFPDLAECQALRYLRLAGADLLVATRIVASDIGMKRFEDPGSRAAATEALNMALKCAAVAAGADHLIDGWHKMSAHADKALRILGLLRGAFRSSSIGKLARLLRRRPPAHDVGRGEEDLWWAWQLAACRRVHPCAGVPFRHTTLLIRTLQDAIHGFYLQALARLPAGELLSRFHRSLLKGGHCYGPFDPVSNIIVNTVWYDAAFPWTHELDMDVIGTRSLHRLENQSLYGMASFLCTRYHSIDFHEAVCFLLEADANLLLADPNLDPEGTMASVYGMWGGVLRHGGEACLFDAHENQDPNTGVQEAFLAAARAAQHPNPDAQVKLLTSCKAMLGPALSLLQGGAKLSSEDVQRIAMLLCPESPCETKPLLPLPLTGYPRAEVADAHASISKEVKAVLNAYEQMPNGDPSFELHTICGVNEYVSGPTGPRHKFYYHSHINFVATPKSPYGGGVSVLFFAEISTNDYNGRSFCCPVSLPLPCAAQNRCLYCEFMGIRIVHPVGIDFHGRELEFEKMACGEDTCGDDLVSTLTQPFYSNLKIINNRCLMTDNVRGRVKEDSLYDDVDGQKRERILSSNNIMAADALFLIPCSSYV